MHDINIENTKLSYRYDCLHSFKILAAGKQKCMMKSGDCVIKHPGNFTTGLNMVVRIEMPNHFVIWSICQIEWICLFNYKCILSAIQLGPNHVEVLVFFRYYYTCVFH